MITIAPDMLSMVLGFMALTLLLFFIAGYFLGYGAADSIWTKRNLTEQRRRLLNREAKRLRQDQIFRL